VIDQRALGILGIPDNPATSLREDFRETIPPEVFRRSVRHINRADKGEEWLRADQLDQMRHDLSSHPGKSLIEANGAAYDMLLKHTVDRNEVTVEEYPAVQ
jgi:type I restriction enzyme R subunit